MGITSTKSTAVHGYQLESCFSWKFSEFVWSEQLVLDSQAHLGLTVLLINIQKSGKYIAKGSKKHLKVLKMNWIRWLSS